MTNLIWDLKQHTLQMNSYFNCMDFAELGVTGGKPTIKNEYLHWESNHRPLAFQAGALDH